LKMGSGGGGGGGGEGGNGCAELEAGGGGGGGGSGNRGGGWIKLYSSNQIVINGTVNATGMAGKTGDGGTGAGDSPNGGEGGSGGSAASSGSSDGGDGGTSDGYGGHGGIGGAGAGGGILLNAPSINASGGTFENRGGGGNSTIGGTIKIFYTSSLDNGTYTYGRLYINGTSAMKSGGSGTTCGANKCIFVQNSTGTVKARFDKFGYVDVNGSFSNLQSTLNPTPGSFIVRNATDVVLYIDKYGNLSTRGTFLKTPVPAPSGGNDFIVKDNESVVVGYIDGATGNMYFKGDLHYNSNF